MNVQSMVTDARLHEADRYVDRLMQEARQTGAPLEEPQAVHLALMELKVRREQERVHSTTSRSAPCSSDAPDAAASGT